mgnify:CR=1 FL=1
MSSAKILNLVLKKSLKLEDETRCAGQGILTIGFAPEELEKLQKTIILRTELMEVQESEITELQEKHQDLKDRYNTCKMSMKLKDNEIEELEEYKEKYYETKYSNDDEWWYVKDSIKKSIVENDDGYKEVHFDFTLGGFMTPCKYIITPKKYYFVSEHTSRKEVSNIIQSRCGHYLGHDIGGAEDDEECPLEYDYLID